MSKFPNFTPKPDFNELMEVLDGNITPKRVHFVELFIDEEIKKYILEHYFNEKNYAPVTSFDGGSIKQETNKKPANDTKEYKNYYKQLINFWHRMGYSHFVDSKFIFDFASLTNTAVNFAKDTAIFSRKERAWAQKGTGLIKSWDDFEKFPWKKYILLLEEYDKHLDFLSKYLPEGMKIAIHGGGLCEFLLERFFGYGNFFYFIYDQPELFKNVVDTLGKINYELYSSFISRDDVGIIFLADDLGFKTSSLISIQHMKALLFPWYKEYASLAHKHKKHIWLHSCGYKDDIMEYLVEDIKIDAIHGFEDANSPVIDLKSKFGERIALLGGVDMDKLTRLDSLQLKKYIRRILEVCMVGGKFALGSGNSICNYIPVDNYFLLIQEGLNWKG